MKPDILAAYDRIAPYVRETPLEPVYLNGALVHLKLEHLQHTGSFKLRGAMNKVLSLSPEELRKGVIAASTGNHGMAVSYAARQQGTTATIYMKQGAQPGKLELIRALGGTTVFHGDNPVHAENKAREHCQPVREALDGPDHREHRRRGQQRESGDRCDPAHRSRSNRMREPSSSPQPGERRRPGEPAADYRSAQRPSGWLVSGSRSSSFSMPRTSARRASRRRMRDSDLVAPRTARATGSSSAATIG